MLVIIKEKGFPIGCKKTQSKLKKERDRIERQRKMVKFVSEVSEWVSKMAVVERWIVCYIQNCSMYSSTE